MNAVGKKKLKIKEILRSKKIQFTVKDYMKSSLHLILVPLVFSHQ